MLSLMKLAYIACEAKDRSLFDCLGTPDVDLQKCCEAAVTREWDDTTCEKAAWFGHLECLRYLRQNACPWNMSTCNMAALSGKLDCLRWAHENGCMWDRITCEYAALGGNSECLRWLCENGCPHDEDAYAAAATLTGRSFYVRYLREIGFTRIAETSEYINTFDSLE